MDMNFFAIFDAIIGVLGAYLVFTGIKSYKSGEVDPMMITKEELARCNDISGLSKYLMPKCSIFGGFCVIPKGINIAFLIAFVVVWGIFSFFIHKAKKTYIH